MKHSVRTAAAAAAITVSSLVGSVEPAQAYQVDCAILLCLAVFVKAVVVWFRFQAACSAGPAMGPPPPA